MDSVTISQQEYTALCLSAETTGWADIATAPKDGTIILGWHDSWHGYHLIMWSSGEGAWVEGSWVFTYPPSHWRYLPAPPVDPSPAIPTKDK